MCAYNRINGVYASEHRQLLTDVLRSEWGFDGFVVSDWAAVHDRPRAVAAGTDLEMPGPRPRRVRSVIDAVHAGILDEKVVDEAALRVLRVIARASATPKGGSFDAAAHHALARRIAAEGMVLLKNDGVLPLAGGGRIAVIGRAAQGAADPGRRQLADHADPGRRPDRRAPQAGRRRRDLVRRRVRRRSGGRGPISWPPPWRPPTDSDVAIVFVAMPLDRRNRKAATGRTWTSRRSTSTLIRAVCAAQPRTVVVLFNGSAVAVAPWIDGAAAVLEAWYSGQAAGGAVADILFGVVEPVRTPCRDVPASPRGHPGVPRLPRRRRPGPVRRGRCTSAIAGTRRGTCRWPSHSGTACRTRPSAMTMPAPRQRPSPTSTASPSPSMSPTRAAVREARSCRCTCGMSRHRCSVPRRSCGGSRRSASSRARRRPWRFASSRAHSRSGMCADMRWVTEAGAFEILIGSSSAAIHAVVPVTVVESAALPSTLSDMSPLQDWLGDVAGRPGALELVRSLAPILGGVFGEAVTDPDDSRSTLPQLFQCDADPRPAGIRRAGWWP